jgi:tRNA-splicing ligase RtcB (3'-phosphate/5'-hydroxy nucleic acid ligase)
VKTTLSARTPSILLFPRYTVLETVLEGEMQQVISDTKAPIKIWADKVEESALAQLRNIGNLPFVYKHVAVMPDVHLGIGATVGSVIATRGAIIPAAVGVDIGCGMAAIRTTIDYRRVLDKLPVLRSRIEAVIPVGTSGNEEWDQPLHLGWQGWKSFDDLAVASGGTAKRAINQLGSLGGGNHFVEVCLDEQKNVWLMLHSGSRNIGKQIAEHHINRARGLIGRMASSLPDPDLAHFSPGSAEFDRYWHDLEWAQSYAKENRRVMLLRVLDVMRSMLGAFKEELRVNCHHNYAAWETHFGEEVLVTRKGAVRAGPGEYGIIPGSMGTRSYIIEGLGNPESFYSCSHGAGRVMSRGQAKKTFSLSDLRKQTAGVECRKDKGVLDEIPGAYKNIDEVMANQQDLVKVVAVLKQVLCVKG